MHKWATSTSIIRLPKPQKHWVTPTQNPQPEINSVEITPNLQPETIARLARCEPDWTEELDEDNPLGSRDWEGLRFRDLGLGI